MKVIRCLLFCLNYITWISVMFLIPALFDMVWLLIFTIPLCIIAQDDCEKQILKL